VQQIGEGFEGTYYFQIGRHLLLPSALSRCNKHPSHFIPKWRQKVMKKETPTKLKNNFILKYNYYSYSFMSLLVMLLDFASTSYLLIF